MKVNNERLRMAHWLLCALALYVIAMLLAQARILPQVQIVTWKLGHETVAAFLGYWIDRTAFRDRIVWDSPGLLHIRRAIIIGAAMLGVGLGA